MAGEVDEPPATKAPARKQRKGFPKGTSTQYFGIWDFGNSSCSTGFGQVYDY